MEEGKKRAPEQTSEDTIPFKFGKGVVIKVTGPELDGELSNKLEKSISIPFPKSPRVNPTQKALPKLRKTGSFTPSAGKKKQSIKDFNIMTSLGQGAYGEVFLVERKDNGSRFALKRINKMFMMREEKEYQIFAEREILALTDDPRICTLHSTFQDKNYLYFLLDFYSNGDLAKQLKLYKKFSVSEIKYYGAQIVDILDYLKRMGIAHRDLKPQNLMLDTRGNLILIDFGTARLYKETVKNKHRFKKFTQLMDKFKKQEEDGPRARGESFVGTALYASPEMLKNGFSDFESDYWSLGILLFRMFYGRLPFMGEQEFEVFQKISERKVDFSFKEKEEFEDELPDSLQDLITKLLDKNPTERFGCGNEDSGNGIEALKSHDFFKGINFNKIRNRSDSPYLKKRVFSPHKNFSRKKFNFKLIETESCSNASTVDKEKKSDPFSVHVQAINESNFLAGGSFPERPVLRRFNSSQSYSSGRVNNGMKVIEKNALLKIDVKRQKFLILEWNGKLTLFDDGSIRFDQYFDKTTRTLERVDILGLKINKKKREARYRVKSKKEYVFKMNKSDFLQFITAQETISQRRRQAVSDGKYLTGSPKIRKKISKFEIGKKREGITEF